MDPNNPNQTNPPQNTAPQLDTTQQAPLNTQPNTPLQNILNQQPAPATPPEAPIASQPNPNNGQTQEPVAQANISTQADTDTSLTNGSYIEDIGDGLIDLLDDINEDENLLQVVANEMELDKERVRETLTTLLDKIDQEQITSEELALIMASTVADEASNKE
jgi:hypothetical protein